MVSIAITGGLACGKSLVGSFFSDAGVPACEADELGHAVIAKGSLAYAGILAEFGSGILGHDEEIDRAVLGRLAFADPEKLARLNALTHPEIMQRLSAWRASVARQAGYAVAVIPLLYEIRDEGNWDAVICVGARERDQVARLAERGLRADEAHRRIAAQMPVSVKMERADYVVFNCAGVDLVKEQVKRVWQRIRGE